DLVQMLELGGSRGWVPPVVRTVATDGRGTDELWTAITAHRDHLEHTGELGTRRRARLRDEVRAIALARLDRDLRRSCAAPAFASLVARVVAREVAPYTAAALLLDDL